MLVCSVNLIRCSPEIISKTFIEVGAVLWDSVNPLKYSDVRKVYGYVGGSSYCMHAEDKNFMPRKSILFGNEVGKVEEGRLNQVLGNWINSDQRVRLFADPVTYCCLRSLGGPDFPFTDFIDPAFIGQTLSLERRETIDAFCKRHEWKRSETGSAIDDAWDWMRIAVRYSVNMNSAFRLDSATMQGVSRFASTGIVIEE